jgi:uncharacterized phage protein gp47/JayE
MAGITDKGLTIKRLPEILDSLNSEATALFQDLVPPGDKVDTTPGSILGRLIGLQSAPLTELWEQLQEVWMAYDPNSASGIALDNQVFLGGLQRFTASPTQAYVFLSGDYNTTIPQGSTVKSSFTGVQFTTDIAVTLNNTNVSSFTVAITTVSNASTYSVQISDGIRTITSSYTSDSSATLIEILNGLKAQIDANASSLVTTATIDNTFLTVTTLNSFSPLTVVLTGSLSTVKSTKYCLCTATETGPLDQGPNTIDTIATPILGWDGVVNYTSATTGRNAETDEELRLRFKNAKYIRGGNIGDALYSDLKDIVGVEEVIILSNETDTTDGNGIPAHSFMALISGGTATDIGAAIWKNKPVGIRTYGSSSTTITDAAGNSKTIYFQRPTPLVYYVTINISTDADFPPDGVDQIKAALVNFNKDTMSIGSDVIFSRLYSPINSVAGHQVNSLHAGTSPSPSGTSNITTTFSQIPTLDASNITITIT